MLRSASRVVGAGGRFPPCGQQGSAATCSLTVPDLPTKDPPDITSAVNPGQPIRKIAGHSTERPVLLPHLRRPRHLPSARPHLQGTHSRAARSGSQGPDPGQCGPRTETASGRSSAAFGRVRPEFGRSSAGVRRVRPRSAGVRPAIYLVLRTKLIGGRKNSLGAGARHVAVWKTDRVARRVDAVPMVTSRAGSLRGALDAGLD